MKKVFYFLGIAALLCLPSIASAQYFEANGIAYNIISNEEHTVEVTMRLDCTMYSGNVVIPSTVAHGGVTYDVVALGEQAFYASTISGITIPSSVKRIKYGCFMSASNLTTITLPASVEEVGELAFAANRLTAINVDEDNAHFRSIGGILFSKDSATLVECPLTKSGAVTLPQNTLHISPSAFSYCHSITGVTLHEGLVSIGAYAFEDATHLNNVIIPASVSYLGSSLFGGCTALNSLTLEEGNTHYFADGMAIYSMAGDTLVSYHKSADSVFLPDGLLVVDGFDGNNNVKYVHIPNSVNTIGANAFVYSSLKSIEMPEQMTEVGDFAFYECNSLVHVGMPTTLGTLGRGCFEGCTKLSSIAIPNGLRRISTEAFANCTSLADISWGDVVEVVDSLAFAGCRLSGLQLPPTVRTVRIGAFESFSRNARMDRVAFSAPVDTIESEVFVYRLIGTLRLMNSIPPATTEFGCLYMADVDRIVVPCGTLQAYQSDSYWGGFASKLQEDCNGIDDTEQDNPVTVYTQGNRLYVRGAQGESVSVFDAAGRQIFHKESASACESVAVPSVGVYIAKIGSDKSRKVVVN